MNIQPGRFTYAGVIDAIIIHRYPSAEMDAINNNYLDDPQNETYIQERAEMKAWRADAKAIAREIFPER